MHAGIERKSEPPGPPDDAPAADRPVKSRPRRSQAERTAESDRRMLRAALKLIGERGYQGTSLAAIGEEAGYSRGLVHERFGSKAGLLWALVKNMLRVWNQQGRARSDPKHVGIDALCDMLDNHRSAIERDEGYRAFYALLFEVLGPIPELLPEFQKLHRDFRSDIERMLRDGIAAGSVRADIDPAAEAVILMSTMRGIAVQWLLEPHAFSLESTYETVKANLRRSLAP